MVENIESTRNEIALSFLVMPKLVKQLISSFKPEVDIQLKKNEVKTLMVLASHPNMPMKHYLEAIGLESGSFTYLIDKLEKKDIVHRVQAENDKRKTVLQLTQYGMELTASVKQQFDHHIINQLESFDEEDLNKLNEAIKLLEQVFQNITKTEKKNEV